MALSRVESLNQFRSIGLTTAIRELIEKGPPEGFLSRFLRIFGERIEQTQTAMDEAMAEVDEATYSMLMIVQAIPLFETDYEKVAVCSALFSSKSY